MKIYLKVDKTSPTALVPLVLCQSGPKPVLTRLPVPAHAEVPVNVGEASVEVRGGEVAKLSCSTPSDIVFCTFVDPSGESFNMLGGLNYEDGRISYLGEDAKKDCGIVIKNVQEKDNGEWT